MKKFQVIQCVMDQNGNHVIQKVIEKVKPSNLAFITDAIEKEKMVGALSHELCSFNIKQ